MNHESLLLLDSLATSNWYQAGTHASAGNSHLRYGQSDTAYDSTPRSYYSVLLGSYGTSTLVL
jgi:hypothetical protein